MDDALSIRGALSRKRYKRYKRYNLVTAMLLGVTGQLKSVTNQPPGGQYRVKWCLHR
jgi:hypothetical protein